MPESALSMPRDPLVYINGRWLPRSQANIPFMDSGFWYGDGLFETLLVANGRIFRPEKHLARMREGMGIMRFDFPVPEEDVLELMQEAVRRNNMKEGMLRLMCTRGTLEAAPWEHEGPSNLYIGFRYTVPEPPFPVKLVFVDEECYPLTRVHPAIKSMTYLGNMLAIRDAVAQGAFEPVFINRDGLVTECATRNIFFIKGNALKTPDVSLGILPGVTRELILELAGDLGLGVDMAPIHRDMVNDMDEAFISSTGIGDYPVTWDGFHGSAYSVSYRIREAVTQLAHKETGGL